MCSLKTKAGAGHPEAGARQSGQLEEANPFAEHFLAVSSHL
jgi:hypothetical protein